MVGSFGFNSLVIAQAGVHRLPHLGRGRVLSRLRDAGEVCPLHFQDMAARQFMLDHRFVFFAFISLLCIAIDSGLVLVHDRDEVLLAVEVDGLLALVDLLLRHSQLQLLVLQLRQLRQVVVLTVLHWDQSSLRIQLDRFVDGGEWKVVLQDVQVLARQAGQPLVREGSNLLRRQWFIHVLFHLIKNGIHF